MNNFYKTTILNTQLKNLKDRAYRRSLLSHGLGSVLEISKTTNLRINSNSNILQELIDDQSYTFEPPFNIATTFKSIQL